MEIKNTQDLTKLIELCRKKGVSSLKMGEFEISLDPAALFPESPYKRKKAEAETGRTTSFEAAPSYSEEDALFWSSAGIAESQEGAN